MSPTLKTEDRVVSRTISMPFKLWKQLDNIAIKKKTKVSQVIRELLEKVLEKGEEFGI